MKEMLPEFGPKLSTVELGAAFNNKTLSDSDKHPSEGHLTRMAANYVEEICEEIAPIGNHCGTQETWIGLGAKFVAILTRLQRQQGMILKDNSDLKSEVMQQQNTILELRKQLNTATEIHRLNFQTSISERLKSQKMTKIDQEPAAERGGRPKIKVAQVAQVDTVTTNERSLDCGQTDHIQDIKDEAETQSDLDEVIQSEHAAPSPQVDNFNQLHGSLRMKQVRSARISESDGKRFKFNLESIQESPTNVRNSQQRSKLYSCGECKKQFNYKSSYTVHLIIHTGEKPYVCKDCGAAFNKAHNLRRHQRIHSGERPYVCKDCGFAFKYPRNLEEHQRSHTGERPYICNDCGVAFNRGATLKRHQSIHTGEKPFACDICKKSFRQKMTLSKHMDIHCR